MQTGSFRTNRRIIRYSRAILLLSTRSAQSPSSQRRAPSPLYYLRRKQCSSTTSIPLFGQCIRPPRLLHFTEASYGTNVWRRSISSIRSELAKQGAAKKDDLLKTCNRLKQLTEQTQGGPSSSSTNGNAVFGAPSALGGNCSSRGSVFGAASTASADPLRSALEPLQEIAWLPVAEGLRRPREVVSSWSFDLSPRFSKPVEQFRALGSKFLRAAGVENKLSGEKLVAVLELAHEEARGAMKQKQEALTVNLMRELAARASEDETLQTKLKTEGCFVLTKHKAMRRNSETFLDDAQWTNGNADAETLHGKVGNDEGRALGCSSVRDELARRCEEGGFGSDEAFGQQERLSDRISSLLHDYNRPEDVFTEHWQNSDDAGAERLLFMIDHTNYPTTSLVDHRASTLQGPALILASSKPLSNDDMARIQSLGDSHKCKDFSSRALWRRHQHSLSHLRHARAAR